MQLRTAPRRTSKLLTKPSGRPGLWSDDRNHGPGRKGAALVPRASTRRLLPISAAGERSATRIPLLVQPLPLRLCTYRLSELAEVEGRRVRKLLLRQVGCELCLAADLDLIDRHGNELVADTDNPPKASLPLQSNDQDQPGRLRSDQMDHLVDRAAAQFARLIHRLGCHDAPASTRRRTRTWHADPRGHATAGPAD
jgi:hypothetical protein